jgi:hypothetical protein
MAMRKYAPCDRDREIVLQLAAIPGITHEQLAFAITNERTGKPITAKTLRKHFAKELETGTATMAKIAMTSFVEQIKDRAWPATRMALANYCGLKDSGEGIGAVVHQGVNNVTFCQGFIEKPDGSLWLGDKMVEPPTALPAPAQPIDVTPDPVPQPDYRPQSAPSNIVGFDAPASFESAFQRKKGSWMS